MMYSLKFSIKVNDGVRIDGIRLYDADYEYLANQTWSSDFTHESVWKGLYIVPEGQQIIGFK